MLCHAGAASSPSWPQSGTAWSCTSLCSKTAQQRNSRGGTKSFSAPRAFFSGSAAGTEQHTELIWTSMLKGAWLGQFAHLLILAIFGLACNCNAVTVRFEQDPIIDISNAAPYIVSGLAAAPAVVLRSCSCKNGVQTSF